MKPDRGMQSPYLIIAYSVQSRAYKRGVVSPLFSVLQCQELGIEFTLEVVSSSTVGRALPKESETRCRLRRHRYGAGSGWLRLPPKRKTPPQPQPRRGMESEESIYMGSNNCWGLWCIHTASLDGLRGRADLVWAKGWNGNHEAPAASHTMVWP